MIVNLQKKRNFQSQKNRNFNYFSFWSEWQGRTKSYAGRGWHLGPCAPSLYRGAYIDMDSLKLGVWDWSKAKIFKTKKYPKLFKNINNPICKIALVSRRGDSWKLRPPHLNWRICTKNWKQRVVSEELDSKRKIMSVQLWCTCKLQTVQILS